MINMYTDNVFINDQNTIGYVGQPKQENVQQIYQGVSKPVIPANCEKAMEITSATDLQHYAAGVVVRLPDFAEGQPFVARIRRPSMLVLAKTGRIPNSLLLAAGQLFTDGGSGLNSADENMLSEMYDIMHIICESALIEPSLDEIERTGLSLSDDQMMAIFNYSQTGINALESFREE